MNDEEILTEFERKRERYLSNSPHRSATYRRKGKGLRFGRAHVSELMKLAREDVMAELQTRKVCVKHTNARFLDFLKAEVPCSLCQTEKIQKLRDALAKKR